MIEFKCDLCHKRKPFAEIYPYKQKKTKEGFELDAEFQGTWSYICLWDFIALKIFEKLGKAKYKYAWCRASLKEYYEMIEEMRNE